MAVLAGREEILARAAALVDQARNGVSGVMTVVGGAGLGKTALLSEIIAAESGVDVVAAVGVPAESSLGFGGLALLIDELDADTVALTGRQRRALESARGRREAPVERVAVARAVVELISTASGRRPLLLIVDDLQWIDDDTRYVLGFLARRLAGQAVAMLLAARDESALPYGVPSPTVLAELSAASSHDLLRSVAPDVTDDVAAVLVEWCAGIPLMLVESLGRLSPAQRQGRQSLSERGPLPASVARAFNDRVDRLGPGAQSTLLLAVCEGRGDVQLLTRLSGAGSVRVLLDARLVEMSGERLRLQHPLLAAAVLERASASAVHRAHEQLASAVADVNPDRAVWHRAQSVIGPDPTLSSALVTQARRQRRRGAPVAAATTLERAAELASGGGDRADLFSEAAASALDGAQPALAIRLVERAEAAQAHRPAALRVRARLAKLHGRYDDAAELLGRAAGMLEGTARDDVLRERLAGALEAGQTDTASDTLDLLTSAAAPADDVVEVASALVAARVDRPARSPQAQRRLTDLITRERHRDASPMLVRLLAEAANLAGDMTEAESLALRAGRIMRSRGNLLGAAEALTSAAFFAFVLGRWKAAEGHCLDAELLVDDVFAPALVGDGLLMRAGISGAQARAATCREQCTRLRDLHDALPTSGLAILADRCEAVLEMGLGNWEGALSLLNRSAAGLRRAKRWHPYLSPASDQVEVLLRLGRRDDAIDAATSFLSRTGPGAPPQVQARALRIRALLAPYGEGDRLFTESAKLDGKVGLPFFQARTQLCHGERLVRERQRSRGSAVLAEAGDTFRRLGATPWVAMAEAEMSVGHPRPSDHAAGVADVLTPREFQIAMHVAEGRRNKEISAAMFLSLRTIEFHLSNIYRKLRVSGRTQLVAHIQTTGHQ